MKTFLSKMIISMFFIITVSFRADALNVIWEKEYGDDQNLSYVPHEAVCKGDLLSVIGYAFESQTQTAGKFWFMQIDSVSTVLSQSNFQTLSETSPSMIGFGSWRTKGAVIHQNNLYFVGTFGTDQPSFSNYGMDDQTFSHNPIQPDPHKTSEDIEKGYKETILKIVDLSNSIILVGSNTNSNGFVKKTNLSGNVSWHNVYKKGTISFIVDALNVGDHLILLECYTESDPVKKSYEGYHCRLLQCDLGGKILSEKTFIGGSAFPNKYPELHLVDSESFLVGYDRNPLPNQTEYSVSAYDYKLELLWEKAVSNKKEKSRIPIYTHVLPVSSGGFVAAHTEMGANETMNIQVQQYALGGDLSSSILLKSYAAIDGFRLVGSDTKIFVVALSMPDETYRTRVRVAAIEMK